MPRFFRKSKKHAGASPGTLYDIKGPDAGESRISMIAYTEDSLEEAELDDIHSAVSFINESGIVWIHILGLPGEAVLSRIGELFNIHALTLEDVVNPGQRPKFEDFETYFYVALKQLDYDPLEKLLSAYHTSLIVCDNVLISFQEKEDPCLAPVKKRIRNGRGRIRKSGSGYLAYALVDSIVDHYYLTLAEIGDEIESLEREMLDSIYSDQLERIHGLKREMIFLRKQIWPVREALTRLMKSESPLLPGSTDRFLADVYDHVIHILDTVDTFRELLGSMLELYMSAQSNRMNEVMRTLTIIATIFIPLTFLAGIYGMNFKFMPELEWQWGYFGLLGIMAAVGSVMVIYFKWKKWF
ncbi:MAG: magnesium/cobalt transporter CorA [Desulfobacter sp.]|nr:MAG: magnesium/cobalt transporter CorA [Desulfobacter sp.]